LGCAVQAARGLLGVVTVGYGKLREQRANEVLRGEIVSLSETRKSVAAMHSVA